MAFPPFAYFPFIIVQFFCFFFYVPYQVEYYVHVGAHVPNTAPGARINDTNFHLANKKVRVSSGSAKAILENPQQVAQAVADLLNESAEQFRADAAPYYKSGIMKQVEETQQYTVCTLCQELTVLFHHARLNDVQVGILIKPTAIDLLKQEPARFYSAYLTNQLEYISLDDATLQRLIRIEKEKAAADGAAAPQVTEAADQEVLQAAEERKTMVTKQELEAKLKSSHSSGKKAGGYLLIFLSVGCAELTIFGAVSMIIPLAIIFGVATFFLIRAAHKQLKKAKQNRLALEQGAYRIVKVRCEKVDINEVSDEDGTYTNYFYTFEDGRTLKTASPLCTTGDQFYFVTIGENDKNFLYYSAINYRMDPQLTVEEFSK